MKITSPRAAAVALAATLALSACASHGSYDAPTSAQAAAAQRTVTVDVSNHNWMDIVVYAVSPAGSRVRLGNVTTGLDQRFRLPRSMNVQTGNIYLEAHPVGSNELYNSGPIMVNPGSRIIWSIENQLSLSNFRIAAR